MSFQNFNYFVEIQIWQYKNYFKLHYVTPEQPLPNFRNFQNKWRFKDRFYGFSYQYRGLLSRGYRVVHYFDSNEPPYHTEKIISFYDVFNYAASKNFGGFITFQGPYEGQFKEMSLSPLLLFQESNRVIAKIEKSVNYQNDKQWYERKKYENCMFYYVFQKSPKTLRYWRANSENVCLPTDSKEHSYNTLLGCIEDNSINVLKNRDTYVGTNSLPIQETYKSNLPNPVVNVAQTKTILIVFLCIAILFSLVALLYLLYKKIAH